MGTRHTESFCPSQVDSLAEGFLAILDISLGIWGHQEQTVETTPMDKGIKSTYLLHNCFIVAS